MKLSIYSRKNYIKVRNAKALHKNPMRAKMPERYLSNIANAGFGASIDHRTQIVGLIGHKIYANSITAIFYDYFFKSFITISKSCLTVISIFFISLSQNWYSASVFSTLISSV